MYYEELYSGAADLSGLRVIVDCAYGAAYAIAPYALRKLGAEVIELHCENDGARINVDCGATHWSRSKPRYANESPRASETSWASRSTAMPIARCLSMKKAVV